MAPATLGFTLALVTGLAAGVFSPVRLPGASLCLAGLAVAWLAYRRRLRHVCVTGLLAAVSAGASVLGADRLHRALHPPLRTMLDDRVGGFRLGALAGPGLEEPVRIEGTLLEDATPTRAGATLRIAVERVWLGSCPEATAGMVSVAVSGALVAHHMHAWTLGRRLRAPVLLGRPGVHLNVGVPDEERALARRGITLVGAIKSAALVEVVGLAWPWEEWAASMRARVRAVMTRTVAPHDQLSSGVATAILIGDRAGLDEDAERRLQEAGTYHVIAISGGNIAIFAGLTLVLLGLGGLRGRLAAAITIGVLAAYTLVAAGGPSVARATVMAGIYLSVRLIDLRTAPVNALALTVTALLVVEPLAIADVGLWLTVGATMAILAGMNRTPRPAARWLRAPAALLVASVCAELALTPVSASVFQRVTIAGLLLNFAAIPCMTVLQLAAMVSVASDLVSLSSLAGASGRLVAIAGRGLLDSARLLDLAPWLAWRVPAPSLVVMALYYAAVVVSWISSRPPVDTRARRRAWRAAAVVAGGSFFWILTAPPSLARAHGDGRLHVTMFDVGQGDGLLVTFPNGRTLVVDAGARSRTGTFDVGERVLGPALRQRGLVRIDYLAITHGDPDHLGGAASLVRDFSPREIWYGVPVPDHEPTRELQNVARRLRAAWRTLQKGDRLDIGGVELRVHHPPAPDWERQAVRNDDSLVLSLRLADVSVLLTGDVGQEVERMLIPELDLASTVVLKAPHHGSASSSSTALLAAAKPAVALFSAGRSNPYGHPVPMVLERYRQAGVEIFRTDLDGQIDVMTDGRGLTVRTFAGRRWTR
jgi:competence protein ComEC